MVNNTCVGNGYFGIELERLGVTETNYNILKNNTLNSNGYDGIYLEESSGNTINNNTCNSNNRNGIAIWASSYISINNVLDNNICLDSENGIYISKAENSIISNNDCFSNYENGIYLEDATHSTIEQNVISNNYRGILSDSSENNTIRDNILWSNILFGISQEFSSNNTMYHNNFIDNTIQAYDDGMNIWNMSYPTGGNYWSDFNEPDEGAYDDYLGVYQNVIGGDGIVDNGTIGGGGQNPYIIDGDSQDNYPLINPFGNFTVLYEGWNLVSIPFVQTETELMTVLISISGSYDAVQWYNASDPSDQWKHYNSAKPAHLNDLNDIDHTMGFMIHITEPGGVIFDFPGSPLTQNQTIALYPGWNMVGYPSQKSLNRSNGLNNITFGIEVDAIWFFDADLQQWYEMGENDYFEPGRGYWIHATTQCEWEVPL